MASFDLTRAAEEDLRGIWRYTFETWGPAQADTYLDQIEHCCEVIAAGRALDRSFRELPADVRIHRCEHHYIVWLAASRPVIIAILHERMDFVRQLKSRL
ncbi:MAG: type II toxin-antitoxin system RelE/ParE family toxin [Arenibacterium sp.]